MKYYLRFAGAAFALILALTALFFSASTYAGDSGSYYDPDRDGEGLQLSRNGDIIQFFFYSYKPHYDYSDSLDDYGKYGGCYGIELPKGGLATEENCSKNRWFYSAGDVIAKDGQQVEGWLYMGLGLDYPKGIPDVADPFKVRVGEGVLVGRYILQRTIGINGAGWALVVIRFAEVLPKDDPVFNMVFSFNTLLFEAKD